MPDDGPIQSNRLFGDLSRLIRAWNSEQSDQDGKNFSVLRGMH